MKIEFDQMIAGLVIATGLCLRCFGINSEVWALVLCASGFLFGTGYQSRKTTSRGVDIGPKPKDDTKCE
jgi:hypothetical protein